MSGKFVRASKFRHVLPKVEKKENNFLDVKAASNGDGNFINTNGTYFSVATTGGGGPVFVHNLNKVGKFAPNEPTLNVHKAAVVDTDWSPFNVSLIATASDDCTAKISQIPDGGMVKGIDTPVATLQGTCVAPCVACVLCSAARVRRVSRVRDWRLPCRARFTRRVCFRRARDSFAHCFASDTLLRAGPSAAIRQLPQSQPRRLCLLPCCPTSRQATTRSCTSASFTRPPPTCCRRRRTI